MKPSSPTYGRPRAPPTVLNGPRSGSPGEKEWRWWASSRNGSANDGSGEMGRTRPPVGEVGVGQAGHTGIAAQLSMLAAVRGVAGPPDGTSTAKPFGACSSPLYVAAAAAAERIAVPRSTCGSARHSMCERSTANVIGSIIFLSGRNPRGAYQLVAAVGAAPERPRR